MKTILSLVFCLSIISIVAGDTFSTGATTNTIPGSLNITGGLTLRNGVNAQSLSIYDTFTDSSNGRYGSINFADSANNFSIATRTLGTSSGTGGKIIFAPLGTAAVTISTNGPVNFANNITQSTGSIKSASSFEAGGAGFLFWTSKSVIACPSDGVILIENQNGNDFNRLQMGGQTASFPSLQRSATNIVARLADDSADTGIRAAYILFGTNVLSFNGTNLIWNGTAITVP